MGWGLFLITAEDVKAWLLLSNWRWLFLIAFWSSISAVLCCAVLCCAVLCYAVLCCAVLCCAVLCCAVLCCAVLCCAVQCGDAYGYFMLIFQDGCCNFMKLRLLWRTTLLSTTLRIPCLRRSMVLGRRRRWYSLGRSGTWFHRKGLAVWLSAVLLQRVR